jgi:hypothetical protein
MNDSTATSNRIALLAGSAGVIMMLLFVGCAKQDNGNDLEADFRAFLETYVQEIKQRNTEYLVNVHPDLPADMHEFFLEATQAMMKYADEQAIEPTIECREYNVCKVTWPQPVRPLTCSAA